MNNLLLFFAIPVATIILAIVLQKLIHSPLLVAATFFAIFLVVTFAAFDESFLVFAIAYTLIAYITALITRFICCLIRNSDNPCINGSLNTNNGNSNDSDEDDCCCCCNRSSEEQNSINQNVANQYSGNYCFPRNFQRRYMIGRR